MSETEPLEVAARLMGDVLRRAYRDHRAEHGCAREYDWNGPAAWPHVDHHCPEADRLWELLPEWDTTLIALAARKASL